MIKQVYYLKCIASLSTFPLFTITQKPKGSDNLCQKTLSRRNKILMEQLSNTNVEHSEKASAVKISKLVILFEDAKRHNILEKSEILSVVGNHTRKHGGYEI